MPVTTEPGSALLAANIKHPVSLHDVQPALVPELRAIDCTTTKDWEQWARERREYADPYGYESGRY